MKKTVAIDLAGQNIGTEKNLGKLDLVNDKYKHFFYNNIDLACFANLEGYFEELNESFTRVLGYNTTDLLNKKFFEFIHPDDIESTLREMKKLSLGVTTLNFINRYRTKWKTYRFLEWNAVINLETKKIYAIARDVTEQITAFHELAFESKEKIMRAGELIIANKELVIANGKLKITERALKEQIIGLEEMMIITSHKIRQPIAHILGVSNLLSKTINLPKKLRHLVDYIRRSALSLNIFTKEITAYMSSLVKKGKRENHV